MVLIHCLMRIKERFLICLNKEIILIIQRKRGFEVTTRSSVEIEKLTEKVRLFAQAKGCVDPSGYLGSKIDGRRRYV